MSRRRLAMSVRRIGARDPRGWPRRSRPMHTSASAIAPPRMPDERRRAACGHAGARLRGRGTLRCLRAACRRGLPVNPPSGAGRRHREACGDPAAGEPALRGDGRARAVLVTPPLELPPRPRPTIRRLRAVEQRRAEDRLAALAGPPVAAEQRARRARPRAGRRAAPAPERGAGDHPRCFVMRPCLFPSASAGCHSGSIFRARSRRRPAPRRAPARLEQRAGRSTEPSRTLAKHRRQSRAESGADPARRRLMRAAAL